MIFGRRGWKTQKIILILICLMFVGCSGKNFEPFDLDNVPVIPDIDDSMQARLRRVHVFGLRRGVRPRVFSFVGDSITAWPGFMDELVTDRVDYGDYHWLADQVSAYRDVEMRTVEGVAYNPLTVESFAVLSGWRVTDVLDPGTRFWEQLCKLDETPLECELRNSLPAVTLVMIGTVDVMHTPINEYRRHMDTVVQTILAYGSIPVLSSLPPNLTGAEHTEAVLEYNRVLLQVADKHQIPVWNYWRALRDLPNQGISADGLHPSSGSSASDGGTAVFTTEGLQYGFNVRNLTALLVLDKVYSVVLNDAFQD